MPKPKRYWHDNAVPRQRRPKGLKGREIGLYYRDLARKNRTKNSEKEHVINFAISASVIKRVHVLLQSIAKTEEGQQSRNEYTTTQEYSKLFLSESQNSQSSTYISDIVTIKTEIEDNESNESFKLPNTIKMEAHKPVLKNVARSSLQSDNSAPGSWSAPDFIPINKEYSNINECNKESKGSFKVPNLIKMEIEEPVLKNVARSSSQSDNFAPGPSSTPDFIPIKQEHFNINDSNKESNKSFKVPNVIKVEIEEPVLKNVARSSSQSDNSAPDSSSTPDFIPIKQEFVNINYCNEGLSCASSRDKFKYDYYDIISKSFQAKLEEHLAKGVSIKYSNTEIDILNKDYYGEYQTMTTKDKYKKMLEFRKKLPTYKMAKELLEVFEKNNVVVVSGETGCGKSTQVPQILLDDAICQNKGANFKVLVTQPRRIAASSLAQRVSEERAERMGNTVGYVVRLEKIDARARGSILYCTTGILLTDLETDQSLSSYSHIILDEVHERDSNVDLAMCMLKQVLKKRKDLKLILMSATLDADRLSAYFDDCSVIHIKGLAYPVKDIYLEEILQLTEYRLPDPDVRPQKRFRGKPAQVMQKDILHKADVGPWLETVKHQLDYYIYKTLLDPRTEELDIDLIVCLLIYISKKEPGAILVFLPGIGDITKLLKEMEISRAFPSNRFEIHPVHSKLPSLQQNKIFERPPVGVRKIVVATNIAETSITIDDIVYVVDCGKIKVSGLNVEDNVATLQTEWVSQANLRQRRGRAGRCQPGTCYHLLTTYRASKLSERFLPELQRSNLLEAVLSIKKLRLGKATAALNMVPDPPALSTIEAALKHLRLCGALDANETLTPLGWHLARLPAHPAAGKLLLLGALFGCLDRAASVAAVWGFKDPFMIVIGKEKELTEAKWKLTLGEPSDHVAISEAIMSWERLGSGRGSFAYEYFLSQSTLQLLVEMKRHFGDNLKQMGFLPTGDIQSGWENRNSNNLSLFKAVIAASLYPNIGSVRWTGMFSRNPNKTPRIIARTPEDGRVLLHPSSVLGTPPNHARPNKLLCKPGANWLVYWLKQKSSQLYLIDVTLVYTLPLLFFGVLQFEDVEESPQECYISFSNIKVRCYRNTANLLVELRFLLDKVLAAKVGTDSYRSVQHNEFEDCVLNAVIEIITAEDEQTEYISDDESTDSDCSDSNARHRYFN